MRKKRDFYSEFHFHFGLRRRVVLLMISLCLFRVVMIESEALEASVDELLKEMAGAEQQTVSFFFLLLLLVIMN